MRIGLRARVNSVTVGVAAGETKTRYFVALELDGGGALQFECTSAEASEWLTWRGKKIELSAALIVAAAPGFKAAPTN